MSPKKIERLIRTLREMGVDYIKTPEIEIKLSDKWVLPRDRELDRPMAPPKQDSEAISAPVTPPPVDNGIPHHVNEMRNLLKLSDAELVDKLFPDYTQQTGNG